MRSTSLSVSIFLFTIGMLFTKLSSFLVNMSLTWKYGASYISDAIIVAISIPTIIFSGLITSVSMCFVPIYKEIENTGRGDKNLMTSNVFNGLSLIVIVVCFFMFVRPIFFIRLLANGMSETSVQIAANIARWIAVACIFSAGSGVLQGYLQANGRFRMVSISSIPIYLVLSACVLISSSQDVSVCIGLGAILAYAFQLLLFSIESHKLGYKWSFILDLRDTYIRRLIVSAVPILISTLIYDFNSIIDKNFASFLEAGSISILEYGFKIAGAAQGIFAYPVTIILYTKLADDSSRGDLNSLKHTLSLGIEQLTLIMVPAITGLMLTSRWITEILFGRGHFNEFAVVRTSGCMMLYLIGMYAVSYRAMMEKVFYSMGETLVTLTNVIVTVVVNVIMDFVGYRFFGCYGLALATSISMIVSALYMWSILFSKHQIKLEKSSVRVCKNVLVSIMAMIIAVMGSKIVIETIVANWIGEKLFSKLLALTSTAIIGIFFYIGTLYVQREPYIINIYNKVLRKD